jgi:AcrR family transcriptional regulator
MPLRFVSVSRSLLQRRDSIAEEIYTLPFIDRELGFCLGSSSYSEGHLDGESQLGTPASSVGEDIVEATIAVVASHGFEATTTELIARRAGVSAADVIRSVGGKDSCCLRAFDAVCEQVDCLLLPIYLRPEPWQDRISAAAFAAASYCREYEERVRFAIDERFRRGRLPLGEPSLRLHLEQVDSIRCEVPEPEGIPAAAAELAVGSFLETLVSLHAEGDLGEFELAVPGLLYNTFRLYLGLEAAEDVLKTLPGP